ncbi:MAG: hypothetical protein FVQ85_10815 [Planctomycetes bacterium]|nr:hypothetical protein [Planctomycetota bacterium]
MIKTLRITTIIAALLAVVFFAFPVVYGYRGDEKIEKFLNSPGAIEKFNKAKGAKVKSVNQISPLVKQAAAFGLYLNPPVRKAVQRKRGVPPVARKPAPIPELQKASVKFDLVGTSYYASRPELSLAYINEPGKGMYWVRQGTKVAHIVIEEVKDGAIVIQDRGKTVTLVASRTPRKSLIKGENTSKSTPVSSGALASITSNIARPVVSSKSAKTAAVPPVGTSGRASRRPFPVGASGRAVRRPPQVNKAEQDKVLADFINELKAMQAESESGKSGSVYNSAEEAAALKEAIADFEAMRITAEEAEGLDRLGKKLGNVEREPGRARSSKVQRSKRPQPPRGPNSPPRPPR